MTPPRERDEAKIRIGYVSGEFRQQATAILMAGLYERHDRDKFEIIALDSGGNDQSAMRDAPGKGVRPLDWHSPDFRMKRRQTVIRGMRDRYSGQFQRLFSAKPAWVCSREGLHPIQVNYLGFPATLGAPYIDYIIADKVVIPPAEQLFYDEQVVYLPDSYQANDDQGRPMAPTPSRAQANLPDKAFVFCNFNSAYKLTPETFDSWMQILKAGGR